MIREVKKEDREIFCTLVDEFFHTDAVCHLIPEKNYMRTFEEVTSNSPYARAYIIEEGEAVAGYGQLSFTYSNEAGGLVMWIEEVYIRPEFQKRGLGAEFFETMFQLYEGKVSRIRLEIEPENTDAKRLYQRLGFEELGYESMIIDF